MRAFLVFASLVVVAFGSSCSKPSPPLLAPETVSVTGLGVDAITLDLVMNATNPNVVDLTVTGVSSHLVVDSTHDIGTVTLPNTITLAAGKTTKIDVPITVKWSDMGLLAQLAASKGAIPYAVDGSLEMGGSLLHLGIPFHVDGTITRDQLLGAVMKSWPAPR